MNRTKEEMLVFNEFFSALAELTDVEAALKRAELTRVKLELLSQKIEQMYKLSQYPSETLEKVFVLTRPYSPREGC